jgi:hypothetical protein
VRRKTSIAALMAAMLVAPATAAGQPQTQPPGGCREFGQNVAGLAQDLGGGFGAAASGAARLEPGGIVTFVVAPEQAAFCP